MRYWDFFDFELGRDFQFGFPGLDLLPLQRIRQNMGRMAAYQQHTHCPTSHSQQKVSFEASVSEQMATRRTDCTSFSFLDFPFVFMFRFSTEFTSGNNLSSSCAPPAQGRNGFLHFANESCAFCTANTGVYFSTRHAG